MILNPQSKLKEKKSVIHIYDKLYITYAEASVGPESSDRTCEDYSQIIDKDLYDINDVHYGKNRIFFGKTLKDLFHQFTDEVGFFRFIQGQLAIPDINKIIIYADENAMNEFLIRWWKGIFPNISEKGLMALYQMFADSQLVQMSNKEIFLNIAVDAAEMEFSDLSATYWKSSTEEIRGLVNCYTPFNVPVDLLDKCSLEFRIMDHIINDRSEFLPGILRNLEDLYKKAFMHDICGCKRNIERNILFISGQIPSFDKKVGFGKKRLKDILHESKELAFLLDKNIKESKESYDYVKSEYDLLTLCQNLVQYDLLIHQSYGLTDKELVNYLDNPFITYYMQNKEHPKLLNLLENEFTSSGYHRIFKGLIIKNRLNPFLVPAFYKLHKSNEDPELIKEFQISKVS